MRARGIRRTDWATGKEGAWVSLSTPSRTLASLRPSLPGDRRPRLTLRSQRHPNPRMKRVRRQTHVPDGLSLFEVHRPSSACHFEVLKSLLISDGD